jgi:heme exporter protein CcmD
MGGYGIYVWGSLGVVLACLLLELFSVHLRFRAIVKSQ